MILYEPLESSSSLIIRSTNRVQTHKKKVQLSLNFYKFFMFEFESSLFEPGPTRLYLLTNSNVIILIMSNIYQPTSHLTQL